MFEFDLFIAAAEGKLKKVKELLQRQDIDLNKQNQEGRGALDLACRHGHLEIVQELLYDPRVDINLGNSRGGTPLYIACQEVHIEVVKFLLNQKSKVIDVNQGAEDNATPFFISCESGCEEITKELLKRPELDVNSLRNDGVSPVFMAASMGHLHIIEIVLASDFEVQVGIQWVGITAAQMAQNRGRPEISLLLNNYETNRMETKFRLQMKLMILGWKSFFFLIIETNMKS